MNELRNFIIQQIDEYKSKHDELVFNEESIIEMSDHSMEYVILYEGIIEGLSIVLSEINQKEIK